jgi:hypothetical protein
MIENIGYQGEFNVFNIITIMWHSSNKTGLRIARTTLGTMEIYFEDDVAPIEPIHLLDTSNYDSEIGLNHCEIVLGVEDDYINHRFSLILKNCVIDSETISSQICYFDIVPLLVTERYYPAMRKLISPKVLIDE